MTTVQGGCCSKNGISSPRRSLRLSCTLPVASMPWSWNTDLAVSRPIMVTLIAGGSLAAGTHDPHLGTSMPLGAVHPIWARLRVLDGIRVARKRVLRLMREHALMSPHRACRRAETAHDRPIITAAPDLMWATDATQIPTVWDGKVWLFGVAEHWNAELLGWHVAKRG